MSNDHTRTNLAEKSNLRIVLTLFIILRLSILFLYTPQGLLNVYTDYNYYYRISQFTDDGYYPFVNMWFEYPPVSTYIDIGAYRLLRTFIPLGTLDQNLDFKLYSRILGTILLLFDAGALILLHFIAKITWNSKVANWLTFLFPMLSIPMFYWNATHNSILIFFTLLAIYLSLRRQWFGSGLSLGLGIATKFTPVFLLPPLFKYIWTQRRQSAAWFAVTTILFSILPFWPFILLGGFDWIVASFKSLTNVASWSTIWALIDGNWMPGFVGDIETRIQLNMAGITYGNPAIIPDLIKLLVFGAIYALFYFQPTNIHNPRKFLRFITFSAMVFILWSKGWSPQWNMLVIPLVLLTFPNRYGLSVVISLSLLSLLEWPVADALQSQTLLALVILARTGILIHILIKTLRKVLNQPVRINLKNFLETT